MPLSCHCLLQLTVAVLLCCASTECHQQAELRFQDCCCSQSGRGPAQVNQCNAGLLHCVAFAVELQPSPLGWPCRHTYVHTHVLMVSCGQLNHLKGAGATVSSQAEGRSWYARMCRLLH